jgi:hypothetical protein
LFFGLALWPLALIWAYVGVPIRRLHLLCVLRSTTRNLPPAWAGSVGEAAIFTERVRFVYIIRKDHFTTNGNIESC